MDKVWRLGTVSYVAPVVLSLIVSVCCCSSITALDWDVKSDTWVATDALGRTLPGYTECGPPREDRTVGIFYFLWLGQHGTSGPYDITKMLAANPDDPQYGPVHAFHHWGESEFGYYLSDDSFVIRRHCNMLVDAGVDVIMLDATNMFPYTSNYMKVCSVYQQIRDDGGRTPQVCFLLNPDNNSLVQTLYNDFYSKNLYPDLWFRWQGKPLILAKPDGLNSALQSFFTFRKCWAWSNSWWFPGTSAQHLWTWLDNYPQGYGYDIAGVPEELSVTIAQHATTNIGRSYHNGSQPPTDQYKVSPTTGEGLCFAEQWSRITGIPGGSAPKIDPQFVFVTGWNEWVAMRFISDGTASFLGQTLPEGESYFVDSYNHEYSRDIEPMKGGHTDNYYYQLISNVRRYKGVRPPEEPTSPRTVVIDGSFQEWDDVRPEYRDHIGDKWNRDHPGWGNAGRYVNKTGRNDFIASKVTYDEDYIYFYVQTKDNITSHTGSRWMWLFIDSDCDPSTGWHGYDYMINHTVVGSATTTVKRNNGGWNWVHVGDISYQMSGPRMEIRVPRADIGQVGPGTKFDFKWMDNAQKDDDITEFFLSGDCAPDRRFNYRYDIAPGPAANLTAESGPERISLSWTNPSDNDLVGVTIRYKTDGYPSSPTDGVLLCDIPSSPGSSNSYVHSGLDTTFTYYYTAFTYDAVPLYTPAHASAVPQCMPALIESFDAYSDGALGGQGGWTTTGNVSAQVQSAIVPNGAGKSILLDPIAAGTTIGNQTTFIPRARGYHYVSLDVRQDSAGGLSSSIVGTVFIYASDATTEILRLRIQKDRIVVDPALITHFPIQSGSWSNVKIGFDVDRRTFDVWFGGVRYIEDYPWKGAGTNIGRIVLSSSRNMSFTEQKAYVDNLAIEPRPGSIPEVRDEGDYTLSLSTLKFSFDPVACAESYRYCVGTTPGGSDARGWTGCAPGEVVASDLQLVEGQQHFVSVQSGSGGAWGEFTASDGIMLPLESTISEAKGLENGSVRAIRGAVVSAVFPDCFYIQEPDKPYGIRVISSASVVPGDKVDLVGALRGAGAERYIDCEDKPFSVTSPGTGVPDPIAMNNKDLGGQALHPLAPGVVGGAGPNNIGLLVRCWGRVSDIDGTTYRISDGSGVTVTVVAPDMMSVPEDGDYALIVGISSLDAAGERQLILPQ